MNERVKALIFCPFQYSDRVFFFLWILAQSVFINHDKSCPVDDTFIYFHKMAYM